MSAAMSIALWTIAAILFATLLVYVVTRFYEARHDITYITHDERGFKRALRGRGVIWDFEESVVKGPTAPSIGFVAIDPASGGRKTVQLLDPRTGAVNLRPHYCAPMPFQAVTADAHKVVVEARVQFSLNRDLLKHVYEIQDLGLALDTRIQSAFRAEIGRRHDEDLRAALHDVERAVIEHLRQAEQEGDEAGEPGMALGVRFHTASFTYSQPDEFAAPGTQLAPFAAPPGASPEQVEALVRAVARGPGALSLRPQQLDQLADVFKGRDPASTSAILSLMEMQTRQNIADALGASGQLVVVTPQELGFITAAALRNRAPGEPQGGG